MLLSVAVSVDGCIDDASGRRLILSHPADLDRVDAERAAADAVLVGANTIRRDDPRLLVRSAERVAARVAAGRPPQPTKVTISGGRELDPAARFFAMGAGEKLVYLPAGVAPPAGVPAVATVRAAGNPLDPARVLVDLAGRGVRRLLVEGGTAMHTLFLTAGLVDELQLAVAPLFVGDPAAPRFVAAGAFPHHAGHRMQLAEARPVGDMVLLRYLLGPAPASGREEQR